MKLTRRGRATAGCGGALVVAAVVLANPWLLAGAAVVGAWLAGCQYSFARQLAAHRETVSVRFQTDRPRPLVEDQTTVSMHVDGLDAAGLPTRVSASLPAAASASEALAVVDRSDASTATESAEDAGAGTQSSSAVLTTVTWPVAGSYRVDPPRVAVSDPLGLFVEAYEADANLDVVVRPRQPDTMHLGSGGERVAAAYGEHTSGQTGPGIEPAELREYQPGDDISQIDWKATARLARPHVVESAAETDRRTVLLLDHRATMGVGRGDVTPIAYLRHAALAIAESATELGDPLGLYAVGDAGVTVSEPPGTTPGQYRSIAASIRALQPTEGPTVSPPGTAAAGSPTAARSDGGLQTSSPSRSRGQPGRHGAGIDPTAAPGTRRDAAAATRASARLADDDSQFASQLRPLLSDATPYLHRVESEPLFAAARTYLGHLQGTVWMVLITDDTRRGELRETVRLARRGNDHVLVILAPRALFQADGLADLDTAYRRYSEFESFRRELASMDRVEALELAPGDRIEAILDQAGGDRS
jgi:uncharacterized protein (DUF58 family)